MSLQKWQLLSSQDVSPSKWFPIENRKYQLPNGKIIDDFTVTTIADVAMIIPITTDKKVVLVRQYKPGVDDLFIQFPAGRLEPKHTDLTQLAQHELEEETGIKVNLDQLTQFSRFSGFSTKGSELVYFYLARDCQFNSTQNFDPTEDVEVLTLTFSQLDDMIVSNQIYCAQTIAGWYLAKQKFPEYLV